MNPKPFSFLRDYTPANRRLFYVLGVVAALLLIPYVWAQYFAPSYVYPIAPYYQVNPVTFVAETFDYLGFQIPIVLDSYMLTGSYHASDIHIPIGLVLALSAVIWLGMAAILSSITYFKLWPYNVCMLVFTSLLFIARLDAVGFKFLSGIPATVLIISTYALLSYFFFALYNRAPYWVRFLSFSALTLVWVLLVAFVSESPTPFLTISAYQLALGLGALVVFVLINGFDLPALFYFFLTDNRGASPRRATIEFTLAMALYLGNILLIYLHNSGQIDWNIIYLNPHYILIVSAALGLWNWRRRFERFTWVTESTHSLTFLFAGLLLSGMATAIYMLATANDPLREALEDLLALGYFSTGLSFFFYVLINFIDMPDTQSLHINLYRPRFMPLLTVPVASAAIVFVFVQSAGRVPLYQCYAGYYNNIGDSYYVAGDDVLAKSFYEEGLGYFYRNNRSNFGVGAIEVKREHWDEAAASFSQGSDKNPSEATFLALAYAHTRSRNQIAGIYALDEARKQGFGTAQVLVSQQYLYGLTPFTDSLKRIEASIQAQYPNDPLFQLNRLQAAMNRQDVAAVQQAIASADTSKDAVKASIIAFQNLIGQASTYAPPTTIPADTALETDRLLLYYNLALNASLRGDTSISIRLTKLSLSNGNSRHLPFLNLANGYNLYRGGNAFAGLRLIGGVEDQVGGAGSPYTAAERRCIRACRRGLQRTQQYHPIGKFLLAKFLPF
jgi:cellulose synthase operon protein C